MVPSLLGNSAGSRRVCALGVTAVAATCLAAGAAAQDTTQRTLTDDALRLRAPAPLSQVPVPEPATLGYYVRDKKVAIALGKALFWDQRAGSQGQACASCHFQAGADPRSKNQLSPGLLGGDERFDVIGDGGGGPNDQLEPSDFPLHRKVDPLANDSVPDNTLSDANDVVSSQGVALARFLGLTVDAKGSVVAREEPVQDPVFNILGRNTRRVEPRNTPTVINAIFNHRNFWDGRANFVFNGVTPFGRRTNAHEDGRLYTYESGRLTRVEVELEHCSLASQAVGPPLSDFEMSAAGKTFPHLGRLLLRHYALSLQGVHPRDSVLGTYALDKKKGLSLTYEVLIQRAFQPRWWTYQHPIPTNDGAFTQLELNFSLFFGLAVQLYEATLVSDQSRFDTFMAGDATALDEREKLGLELFLGPGRCGGCHGGPAFSAATFPAMFPATPNPNAGPVLKMQVASGIASYDGGFYNIGVRPFTEDLGVGGTDPYGDPLSFAAQLSDERIVDGAQVPLDRGVVAGDRVAVSGSFKAPILRNVALTAPYMHNGGMLTLEQVVEFYARGGDFHDRNIDHLDRGLNPNRTLLADPQKVVAIAAFLRSLTDPRVVDEQGPFDHPSLTVPNGVGQDGAEELLYVPSVGSSGRRAAGVPPIRNFLAQD